MDKATALEIVVAVVVDLCSLHLRTVAEFVLAQAAFLYQFRKIYLDRAILLQKDTPCLNSI